MAPAPPLLLPRPSVEPLRALARRVVTALGLWLLVAAITYVGRGGYRDVDDSDITLLDAVYYASVSVTTTGYGDITPVSASARAITAFIVTPARILYLIVLVGTTVELLTERYRALPRPAGRTPLEESRGSTRHRRRVRHDRPGRHRHVAGGRPRHE